MTWDTEKSKYKVNLYPLMVTVDKPYCLEVHRFDLHQTPLKKQHGGRAIPTYRPTCGTQGIGYISVMQPPT